MSIDQLTNVFASVTLFEMMVAIGLGVSSRDVLRVATNGRLVSKAAVASYVLVPAAAVGLLILFRADPYVAAGFLIAAVCPGAPYGPPFTAMAGGNLVVSVGLMVILAGSSALAAPLLLQILLPWTLRFLPPLPSDGPALAIDALHVIRTLLIAQFLPLCIGLVVRRWHPSLAETLKKPANLLSMVLNLATLGLIFAAQFDMLIGIPLRGFTGMLLLVLAGVAAGWLLGGRSRDIRIAMVMATSVRNVGVGLVIATGAFAGTRAVAATTAFALFQTVAMALIALGWGRMASASSQAALAGDSSTDCSATQIAL
jgi:BASS family bile acid:Na+ symporter